MHHHPAIQIRLLVSRPLLAAVVAAVLLESAGLLRAEEADAAQPAPAAPAGANAEPPPPGVEAPGAPPPAGAGLPLPGIAVPGIDDLLQDPPDLPDLDEPEPPAPPSPSEAVVVNLIVRLVQKGILTQAEAQEMIVQAERDAAVARQNAELAALVIADARMAGEQDQVVAHVPEPVKARLREEIKSELAEEAREGRWEMPGAQPEWLERLRVSGDFRFRYEGTMFPEGNDNTGAFPDFNRINTGDPFDVSGLDFSPQNNVDEERHRLRIRARLGGEFDLLDGFTAGMRIATGNDGSPVSTNQTLGGSGGNFSKYSLWLDRAFLKWETGAEAAEGELDGGLALTFGRFDNPFFRTSEIMWDNDLGFDGFGVQARQELVPGITPFASAGLFPIYNTEFNFASNNPAKFESIDKWLYGLQGGLDLRRGTKFGAKFGIGLFEFDNVEGRLSDPFLPLGAKDAGNTDITRPSFAQRGNTYMALRDIIPDPLNNFGTSQQYQYFGLASRYQVLSYNGRVDLNFFEPVQVSLLGEYAVNLAHDPEQIEAIAVNNRGPLAEGQSFGRYAGGDTAWNLGIQFGKDRFEKAGDWNTSFGYRYVESDAVLDAFNDSDFGLGGTNVEGFTVGAQVALSRNVFLGFRWMGANEIAGPPVKSDLLQIDLNASF
jgi:hypothetical protein